MSFQETAGDGFFPGEREEPEPRSTSWSREFIGRFGRRTSGQLSEGDAEAPLLPNDEHLSPGGRDVAHSPGWPALRLSSMTTRKLHPQVGSWGQDDQVGTPLAGGFPSSSFLPQPSPRAPEPLPFFSPVAASGAALEAPPPPCPSGGAEGGGERKAAARHDRLANAAVVGAVNSIVAMPIILSFAAIIFRDPFFKPLLGSLVKVVFLSSALHQLVFTLFSSLPFAVGQVQDVGLIFLSAMASDVVGECAKAGAAEKDTLATALMTLTISTALVGLLIVLTGVLKLASLVQYVPLPVVGGYLAFVGWFCLAAGVSLASGVQVSTPETWANLADKQALIRLAPALGTTLLIALTLRRFRSPFALPLLLLAVPVAFYVVLWAAGLSLEDARDAGWVSKPQEGGGEWQFWKAWSLYNIHKLPPDNIYWHVMPTQAAKLVALYFVVAFGSSMDVAAIQAESPRDLDYNQELTTVGISNLVSGLCGVGYTGSYIFSQTLFSMRMGVDSPLTGAIIVVSELAIFALPYDVMTFLPNLFFGALVMWIGQDILKDWLFIAYKRVRLVEYLLLLGTLAAIMALGLEAGIACGIVAAAVHFAYSYSRVTVTAFSVVPSRSGAVRTFEQRTALEMFAARITAVSLSGYLFFGSSVKVSERVIEVATATLEPQPHKAAESTPVANGARRYLRQPELLAQRLVADAGTGVNSRRGAGGDGGAEESPPTAAAAVTATAAAAAALAMADWGAEGMLSVTAPGEGGSPGQALPAKRAERQPTLPTVVSGVQLDATYDAIAHFSGLSRDWATAALEQAPRYLILDFRRVQGLDATAARTFVTLHTKLHRRGIQLIITHLPASRPGIRKLLVAQGLILREPSEAGEPDEGSSGCPVCRWFETMEAGLQHCEEQFLEVAVRHRLCRPTPHCVTLADVLRSHLEFPRSILPLDLDCDAVAAQLGQFAVHEEIRGGEVLFERGEPADDIYILECGSVLCAVDFMHASVHSRAAGRALPQDVSARHSNRLFKYGAAGIVGELDFYLERTRSFSAICDQSGSAWRISRRSFERMAREQPRVLAFVQTIILRATSLSAAHALEALERSSPE